MTTIPPNSGASSSGPVEGPGDSDETIEDLFGDPSPPQNSEIGNASQTEAGKQEYLNFLEGGSHGN
jgi:hypothetical protein